MRAASKRRLNTVLYHTFVWLLGFFMLYPVLWLVASSLKGHSEIFQRSYSLIPRQWELNNYLEGWKGFGGISIATFFKNSFLIIHEFVFGLILFDK